jgi:hypothetical protein
MALCENKKFWLRFYCYLQHKSSKLHEDIPLTLNICNIISDAKHFVHYFFVSIFSLVHFMPSNGKHQLAVSSDHMSYSNTGILEMFTKLP